MRFHLWPNPCDSTRAEGAHFHGSINDATLPNPVVATNRVYPLDSVRKLFGRASGVGHVPHEFELASLTLNRDKGSRRNRLALDLNLGGNRPPRGMVCMFDRLTLDHCLALSVCTQSKYFQSRAAWCLGFGMLDTSNAEPLASAPLHAGAQTRLAGLASPWRAGQADARGVGRTLGRNLDHAGIPLAT